ncbi:MAG TPA: hypothetical protein VJK29_08640 [Terriglobales bacterium]|nr:hypothetical protein [Terriglobales bacterium]
MLKHYAGQEDGKPVVVQESAQILPPRPRSGFGSLAWDGEAKDV